jgi:protein TonB
MQRHVDILEGRDSLKGAFAGSLGLHCAVFGAIAFFTLVPVGKREPWGDPNALGGGAFTVTPVRSIPIEGRTGPVNRLARDTRSQIPEPVKPETKKAGKREDPDAIALKSKRSQAKDRAERRPLVRTDKRDYDENQLTSRVGQAAVSPLFSATPGSGGVGVGAGAPFGARFGAYAKLLSDRVAQKWRTDSVDPRIRTLPAAIVTFEILRDGQIRNVRVVQSSGNVLLDNSAQRAIFEAAPFPPLPATYEGNSAVIEFWFQLKR